MILKIKKLHKEAIIPKYSTRGSVGFDIHAMNDTTLYPGNIKLIHTGIAVELPKNYEMTVRQRSGLSIRHPNYIVIGIGTIDSDYRGEIIVPCKNNNNTLALTIKKGDRIAQCIVSPVLICDIVEADELSETDRGEGGFGHTGS